METADRDLTADDRRWLRVSFDLARRAAEQGDQPYGALLVDDAGNALLEGLNSAITTGDCTGHAETNVVREASQRFSFEMLARCTLYASTEPCVMCAGAIFWSQIGRVVYGVSSATLEVTIEATGEAPPVGCRDVLGKLTRVVLLGPALEDEALLVHSERQ